jgi:hypothetical protein
MNIVVTLEAFSATSDRLEFNIETMNCKSMLAKISNITASTASTIYRDLNLTHKIYCPLEICPNLPINS